MGTHQARAVPNRSTSAVVASKGRTPVMPATARIAAPVRRPPDANATGGSESAATWPARWK